MNKSKEKLLQSAIYGLFKDQQFYGGLLQELNIRFMETKEFMAAIAYNKKTREYEVLLGDLWLELEAEERTAVLKHEVLHFTNGHLIRFPWNKDTPKQDKDFYNLAGDMAINQFIQHMPEGTVDVSKWKLKDGKPYPKFKSMEVYYDLIKTTQKENKKILEGFQGPGSEGQQPVDVHDWEKLSDEEKKEQLEAAKKIFERTVEKTNFDHSMIPDYVKDLMKEIDVNINGLNYKRILRDCIKKSVCASDRDRTWTRRNKRFGMYAPGTKMGTLPHCDIQIDTSGSISHTEMNEFLEVVSGFLKNGSRTCSLGLWHTELYHLQKYKLNGKIDPKVMQSGGTDVTEVLERIHKVKPDLAVILTDGYYGHNFKNKLGNNVIWVISKNGTKDHPLKNVGKTVKMT